MIRIRFKGSAAYRFLSPYGGAPRSFMLSRHGAEGQRQCGARGAMEAWNWVLEFIGPTGPIATTRKMRLKFGRIRATIACGRILMKEDCMTAKTTDRECHLAGLYLILTEPAAGYERLAEIAVAERVCAIQLRDKKLDSGPLLALARRLREITKGSKTLFFINDRPDIARLAEADGLHLGQTDLKISEARQIVGKGMLIGKSTHNLRELAAALKEKPDYVGIGPVFGTQSKTNASPALGIEKALAMLETASLPSVAIGGITAENLPELLQTGFHCYAMISAVGSAADPRAAIRQLKRIERKFMAAAGDS